MPETGGGDLTLTIRVNKETGNLEIAGAEVKQFADQTKSAAAAAKESSTVFDELQSSMMRVLSVTAVLSFIKDAIKDYVDFSEANRALVTQLNAVGQATSENIKRAKEWEDKMQDVAHVSNTEAAQALTDTIRRTKDLDQAMKMVQLSQDIAVASNKDMSYYLNLMTRAAAGSRTGMIMLRQEFGAQISGAKTVNDALNQLATIYGGTAEKAHSFRYAMEDVWNTISDRMRDLGKDFAITFQMVTDAFFKPLLSAYDAALASTRFFSAELVALIVGPLEVIKTGFVGLSKVMSDSLHGNFKQAVADSKQAATDVAAEFKLQAATIKGIYDDWGKEINKSVSNAAGQQKKTLEDLHNINVENVQADIQTATMGLAAQLKAFEAEKAKELATLNKTQQERIDIINRYAVAEIEANRKMEEQFPQLREQSEAKIKEITASAVNEVKKIRNEGLTDHVKATEQWLAAMRDVDSRYAEMGRAAFDGTSKAFGDSVSKMLVEGKSFEQQFKSLMQSVEEQAISSFVQTQVKHAFSMAFESASSKNSTASQIKDIVSLTGARQADAAAAQAAAVTTVASLAAVSAAVKAVTADYVALAAAEKAALI